MAAYLIANYRIVNPEGYAAYPPAVAPTLTPYGGELIVADFDSEVVEGAPAPVSIVVRFPDKESARRWYDSDAYRAVLELRTLHTDGWVAFTDGVA
jgi:uncharacterized protein (DUF1330 family)